MNITKRKELRTYINRKKKSSKLKRNENDLKQMVVLPAKVIRWGRATPQQHR